ncbi:MAG: hypothetical protein H6812_09635 [Phycisphaeraceae bacterium]|nr:hypothetical protein [Phycisphaerales bacterium]MCB9843504.1 hypothetical protein [Phycisphaeraceae bacterium]
MTLSSRVRVPEVRAAIVIAAATGVLCLQSVTHARPNPCDTVAKNQKKSDLRAASAEFFNAVGKAQTFSNIVDRIEAIAEAKDSLAEAISEANDRFQGRLEICDRLDESYYEPDIDPSNFMTPEDAAENPNPYWPLVPGTTTIFEAETEDGPERIEVTVTEETREILGVECFEVIDTVYVDDEIVEDTRDWYAVDVDGNVWYFGEITLNYEDGKLVDIEGSWEAGVDGAKPGIAMFAHPEIGRVYRQEFLLGEAEDIAEVHALDESVEVPFGAFDHCVLTHEYNPIAPELIDLPELKYYAPGVGFVLELNMLNGEVLELVEVIAP